MRPGLQTGVAENGSGDQHGGEPLLPIARQAHELCTWELHGRLPGRRETQEEEERGHQGAGASELVHRWHYP